MKIVVTEGIDGEEEPKHRYTVLTANQEVAFAELAQAFHDCRKHGYNKLRITVEDI